MFKINEFSIFAYRDHIDFRKSINGLAAIVQYQMHLNLFKKYLFLFRNKQRDKIKILYWDDTGFALWYKVLEKEKFPWPIKHENKTMVLNAKQLEWLLRGIDYWSLQEHKKIFYEDVC